MKVTSTQVAFIDGKRIRPGTVFEIPDDHKLGEGMSQVGEDGKPAKAPAKGDTKPAGAQAAAKAKNAPQTGEGGDTKPADAATAAAAKTGGGASLA